MFHLANWWPLRSARTTKSLTKNPSFPSCSCRRCSRSWTNDATKVSACWRRRRQLGLRDRGAGVSTGLCRISGGSAVDFTCIDSTDRVTTDSGVSTCLLGAAGAATVDDVRDAELVDIGFSPRSCSAVVLRGAQGEGGDPIDAQNRMTARSQPGLRVQDPAAQRHGVRREPQQHLRGVLHPAEGQRDLQPQTRLRLM